MKTPFFLNIGLNFTQTIQYGTIGVPGTPHVISGSLDAAPVGRFVHALLEHKGLCEDVNVSALAASEEQEGCLCVSGQLCWELPFTVFNAKSNLHLRLESLCDKIGQDCIALAYVNPPVNPQDGVLVFNPHRPNTRNQWGEFNPKFWRWTC